MYRNLCLEFTHITKTTFNQNELKLSEEVLVVREDLSLI